MIELMKYTYMMDPDRISEELDKLWGRYKAVIDSKDSTWEEINEARALLYLTGQIYCEKIAVEAIERRLHLLKEKFELVDFLNLIDTESDRLRELRSDEMFMLLEKFYRVIKKYKNRYISGKYYLEEEKFLEKYDSINPDKSFKMGYRGKF